MDVEVAMVNQGAGFRPTFFLQSVCALSTTLISIGGTNALATEIPVQARLFVGSTTITPTDLNTELSAQTLKTYDAVTAYGVEITYPVLSFIDFGLRYTHRYGDKDETTSDSTTDYSASLLQDSVIVLARVPLLKSDWYHADLFVGAGGSNSSLKIKSATQDGELTKREGGDWFASPVFNYGGSVGVGYKHVLLTVEVGFETNKVDGFKRTGTINNNVQSIDFGGRYVLVGLMLDGIPGTIH